MANPCGSFVSAVKLSIRTNSQIDERQPPPAPENESGVIQIVSIATSPDGHGDANLCARHGCMAGRDPVHILPAGRAHHRTTAPGATEAISSERISNEKQPNPPMVPR